MLAEYAMHNYCHWPRNSLLQTRTIISLVNNAASLFFCHKSAVSETLCCFFKCAGIDRVQQILNAILIVILFLFIRYFNDDSDSQTDVKFWWHKKLADYFENCVNLLRKIEVTLATSIFDMRQEF
jgi:hypothetical protein